VNRTFILKVLSCFCLVILHAVLLHNDAMADWLLLLHADGGGKLSRDWAAKVETEFKFRENMSEFYDLEAMPWFSYSPTEWFTLGLGWRELYCRQDVEFYGRQTLESSDQTTYQRLSDHYWQAEHRPLIDFIFKAVPDSWTLEDRLRTELRMLEIKDPFFRLRNRVKLLPPWKWTKAEIQLWAAWEAYFEFNPDIEWSDRLTRNRFFAGVGMKATSNLKFGLYYYWEVAILSKKEKYNNEIGFGPSLVF